MNTYLLIIHKNRLQVPLMTQGKIYISIAKGKTYKNELEKCILQPFSCYSRKLCGYTFEIGATKWLFDKIDDAEIDLHREVVLTFVTSELLIGL